MLLPPIRRRRSRHTRNPSADVGRAAQVDREQLLVGAGLGLTVALVDHEARVGERRDLADRPAVVLGIVGAGRGTRACVRAQSLGDDPKDNSGAVSEITALSNTSFVVDERDGKPEPGAYKKLFTIDLRGATDVGREGFRV